MPEKCRQRSAVYGAIDTWGHPSDSSLRSVVFEGDSRSFHTTREVQNDFLR